MQKVQEKKIIRPVLSGFTLIEVVVGIFIFVLIASGLVALVSGILSSSAKQSNLLSDSDQSRKVAFGITNELRNAQTSSTGGYAIQQADAQALVFYSNIDRDSLVERVRYYVQNGKLYRGVIKPSGNPLAYNLGSETVFAVQNNLANTTTPVFYYYNDSYDGSADNFLPSPVSVTAVKYVKINLMIYNKAGVLGNSYYTVTASGAVRNLKDNLGDVVVPPPVNYSLATTVSPGGSGMIASSPTGSSFLENTLVNLTAYPAFSYGFSSWSGGVANPSSASTTIVMNGNKTVTANFVSLPPTMTASITNKNGSMSSRRWTLRINNNNSFWVNSTELYSFSLTQTAGSACAFSVTVPTAYPASIGDITANGNRTYQVTIDFGSCGSSSRFRADFSFAGNGGSSYGIASIDNQTR